MTPRPDPRRQTWFERAGPGLAAFGMVAGLVAVYGLAIWLWS
jgi:hypothetical protein